MDTIEEIKKLASLLKSGAITQEEFISLKQGVISGNNKEEPIQQSQSKKETEGGIVSPVPGKKERSTSSKKLTVSMKDAVDMLYKMDVDIAEQNLVYYSQVSDYKKVELLLIAGVDPNIAWYNAELGRNVLALHNTAGFGNPKMVKLLLEYEADVNLTDEFGYTALFYAIDGDKIETIKLLVEFGTDINHKANNNIPPLLYAQNNKKLEIAELLKNAGAEELPSKGSNVFSNLKHNTKNQSNQKKGVSTSGNERNPYALYLLIGAIALIIIISIIAGFKENSFTTGIVTGIIFLGAYFISFNIFLKYTTPFKTVIYLTIIPVIVFIGSVVPTISSSNCQNSQYEYQNGYSAGSTVRLMGGSGSCGSYVDSYNNQTGRNTMSATDCYCEGYNDGLSGDKSKY